MIEYKSETPLDQLQPVQARMPVLADDDVVVHGDAERLADIDDRYVFNSSFASGFKIATRLRAKQNELEHLVVAEHFVAGCENEKSLAQPLAMAFLSKST